MPDRMPEDMPDKVPECLPNRTPEDLPDRIPDRMSEDMPEDMPDRVPEDMPEHIAEDMPGRMPDDMPDRMPEDMPDKMPEDMSDRMPEDLPVTKRIDVMVGITRSKVIAIVQEECGSIPSLGWYKQRFTLETMVFFPAIVGGSCKSIIYPSSNLLYYPRVSFELGVADLMVANH